MVSSKDPTSKGLSWQNMLPPLYSVSMVKSSKGEGCNIIYYLHKMSYIVRAMINQAIQQIMKSSVRFTYVF